MNKIGRYFLNLAILLDEAANTLAGVRQTKLSASARPRPGTPGAAGAACYAGR
jgi:hypothetical protein